MLIYSEIKGYQNGAPGVLLLQMVVQFHVLGWMSTWANVTLCWIYWWAVSNTATHSWEMWTGLAFIACMCMHESIICSAFMQSFLIFLKSQSQSIHSNYHVHLGRMHSLNLDFNGMFIWAVKHNRFTVYIVWNTLSVTLKLDLFTCCETVDLSGLVRLTKEKLGITFTEKIGKMFYCKACRLSSNSCTQVEYMTAVIDSLHEYFIETGNKGANWLTDPCICRWQLVRIDIIGQLRIR